MSMNCFFNECPNTATKLVYRLTTDEEKAASTIVNEFSKRYTEIVQIWICDVHLEEAQKVYPFIASL
jgi:hypothetical protein